MGVGAQVNYSDFINSRGCFYLNLKWHPALAHSTQKGTLVEEYTFTLRC